MNPITTQKTIKTSGRLEGVGLHSGKACAVTVRPARPGSGIRFFRNGREVFSLTEATGSSDASEMRCSSLAYGVDRILTVEHLLAALAGLGVTNIEAEVEGPEIPGMDGSAKPFADLLLGSGIVDQGLPAEFYKIEEPVFCYDKNKAIAAFPSEQFQVSYTLDYDHPHLRGQKVDFTLTEGMFRTEIAPARTFCTQAEAGELKARGMGLGASPENTLVVMDDGSHRAGLRFDNECARHKVLDIMGDLMLLGAGLKAHVIGVRSGHALNRRLVQAIREQAFEGTKK